MNESIPNETLEHFEQSLYFLHINELRDLCEQLSIPNTMQKLDLIQALVYFAKHNRIVKPKTIPSVSKIPRGVKLTPSPSTLMLKGSFKNDYAHLAFLKSYIGNHFRYTVYGLDFIKERWYAGNPPTYAEFKAFWEQEYRKDQQQKRPAKREWQYILFTQSLPSHLTTPVKHKLWNEERAKRLDFVLAFIEQYLTDTNG